MLCQFMAKRNLFSKLTALSCVFTPYFDSQSSVECGEMYMFIWDIHIGLPFLTGIPPKLFRRFPRSTKRSIPGILSSNNFIYLPNECTLCKIFKFVLFSGKAHTIKHLSTEGAGWKNIFLCGLYTYSMSRAKKKIEFQLPFRQAALKFCLP